MHKNKKMIGLQKLRLPVDCVLVNNDFYDYDPVNSFNEADSLKYLNEDLFQCTFPLDHVIIDIGWYGDLHSNSGEFRIYVIMHENWEIPFNVIHAKTPDETMTILIKILHYYTRSKIDLEYFVSED